MLLRLSAVISESERVQSGNDEVRCDHFVIEWYSDTPIRRAAIDNNQIFSGDIVEYFILFHPLELRTIVFLMKHTFVLNDTK